MGKNIRYCAALAAITAMVSLSGCGGTDDGTERGTQSPAAEETSGGAGDATGSETSGTEADEAGKPEKT